MATHGKFLHTDVVTGMKYQGSDINIGVYGIFNTSKVLWKYYVISYQSTQNGIKLTSDICGYAMEASYEKIESYGKSVKDVQEGKAYCDEFKAKWESGSNDSKQEIRDQLLNKILP